MFTLNLYKVHDDSVTSFQHTSRFQLFADMTRSANGFGYGITCHTEGDSGDIERDDEVVGYWEIEEAQ